MAITPDIHINYHFHALPRAKGRVVNPPQYFLDDPYNDLAGQTEQNVMVLEYLFNHGDFDGLMARFPPCLDEDEAEIADKPYAFNITRRDTITNYTRVTGTVYMDADFVRGNMWRNQEQFELFLKCEKEKRGNATVRTCQGKNALFDFAKKDVIYRRKEGGLYEIDPFFEHKELILTPRPAMNTEKPMKPNWN